ncbi:MAG: glycosyltransferase [Calditrichaceae bacterium]|nr:glycosyltransferase [Calditrichaceae bacterium]MBN2708504.1 glycosyltransferase [Calditrichaceae bacterium]RQV96024.1 MAG: glycosyltransferase [Calditrichota bacterium]
MKISVVIPVFNRATLIERAIKSVLNQSESPYEIIVVDDGSTDNTSEILLKFRAEIKIITQDNKGVSLARNRGINAARGEWISFLDSDDEWLPDKLEHARKFHELNPQYAIFQSEEIWVRNGKRVNPQIKHKKYGGWLFNRSLPLCIVSPSAVVIHRQVFEKAGLFDEHFPVCEDYDLWLRVSRYYEIGLDPIPGIIKYGGHADQLSRKYWGMDRYRVKAIEKHLQDPELPAEYRFQALKVFRQKLNIIITGIEKRNNDATDYREKLALYDED